MSELPLVTKWPAIKVGRMKKTSVLLLKRMFFLFCQLWRLAILEPVGVQRHNVPHFKGLIVLYMDSRSSRARQHFYLLPRPFGKGHFTPINSNGLVCSEHHCNLHFQIEFRILSLHTLLAKTKKKWYIKITFLFEVKAWYSEADRYAQNFYVLSCSHQTLNYT